MYDTIRSIEPNHLADLKVGVPPCTMTQYCTPDEVVNPENQSTTLGNTRVKPTCPLN